MGWFGWWRHKESDVQRPLQEWHAAWERAVESPTSESAAALRERLDQLGLADDEQEIEREMLVGLHELVQLTDALTRSGPAPVFTGHKAVGPDTCYFTTPASVPDDPAQPFGTLLLTNARVIFVGGARAVAIPWHRLGTCDRRERDVLLVRSDGQDVHRFRCNTYGDALRAVALVRHLMAARRV